MRSGPLPELDASTRLTGQVVIVTGAGSGIGRGTAFVLAAAGAHVVCADMNAESAAATAASIRQDSGRATEAVVDIRDRTQVDEVVAATVASHGRLDGMCNIAGAIRHSPVLDLTEADLDWSLAVNLKGALFGSQAAGRVMVERGRGSIVNMSSGTIDSMARDVAAYAMAKAAVVQLTRSLAMELGGRGVRVNAVAPGYVVTELTAAHYRDDAGNEDESHRESITSDMAKAAAVGRIGDPVDIGFVMLFLLSDASSFMTGQLLRPNGGIVMPW